MKRMIVPAGLAVAVLLIAWPARAACSVQSSHVVFPPYDVYATAPLDAAGKLHYKCLPDPTRRTAKIHISFGPSPNGGFQRAMSSGGDRLQYNVYLDPDRKVVWGDGSHGTRDYIAARTVDAVQTVHLYARIPPGQDVAAGTYADALVMSLDF